MRDGCRRLRMGWDGGGRVTVTDGDGRVQGSEKSLYVK
jgi:hypothetical protein